MIHLHGIQAVAFRVLIVDNDPIEREIFARCVEMLGWTATSAAGVDDASDTLSTRAHDVVVIDLRLAQPDCLRLLRRLRDEHADPAVIFVAGAGGRNQAAALRLARDLGLRIAGILARPIDPYRLHALLLSNPPRTRAARRRDVGYPSAHDLEQALLAGEIHTEYQPKTDLVTGEIVGVEALARWHSPTLGAVPPDQFVAVAEQSELIGRLTSRVLRDAALACRRWRAVRPDCSIAVNISPFILSDPGFLPMVEETLQQNGLPPDALIAEITESTLLAHMPMATEVLTRLSIKGVRVSMDGFGTGYSSMQSLLRMPFTELKIDRSFVGVCRTDPDAWKLVRATISLARELDMHVVAEGVESEAISDRLRDVGCDMGQGWYFGRPMQDDAMLRWLMPETTNGALAKAVVMASLLTAEASHAPARWTQRP
jgi:EAL domain-containing protein (putative c-di-GMP-specific phosphodiesterase class I)/ActR/RegA family two-component response regulator